MGNSEPRIVTAWKQQQMTLHGNSGVMIMLYKCVDKHICIFFQIVQLDIFMKMDIIILCEHQMHILPSGTHFENSSWAVLCRLFVSNI